MTFPYPGQAGAARTNSLQPRRESQRQHCQGSAPLHPASTKADVGERCPRLKSAFTHWASPPLHTPLLHMLLRARLCSPAAMGCRLQVQPERAVQGLRLFSSLFLKGWSPFIQLASQLGGWVHTSANVATENNNSWNSLGIFFARHLAPGKMFLLLWKSRRFAVMVLLLAREIKPCRNSQYLYA